MEVTIFGFIEAVSQTSASLALDQDYNRVALQRSSQPWNKLYVSMRGNYASRYS